MLKIKTTLYFVISLVVFLNINPADAQIRNIFKDKSNRYTTVGFGGGSSHYFGDLSPYSKFYYAIYSNVRWNGTINYQMHLNQKVSARVGFTYARIFGNDATYGGSLAESNSLVKGMRLRNLHFRNDLMEFSFMGIYTFFSLDERKHKNQKLQWSPYAGAGIALIGNNPKARGSIQDKDNGYRFRRNSDSIVVVRPWTSLKPLKTEGQESNGVKAYSSIAMGFPIVLGIKTKINNNWILSVEGGLRFTLSDYLDDVGTNPYDLSSELSYRADEDYNAVSGKPRHEMFKELVNSTQVGNLYPSTSALALSGINVLAPRGSKNKDSYIVTQITLNYIIGNRVKCPPLKQ